MFKVTREDGGPTRGSGKWPLPRGKKLGAWREVEGPLVACENGLHLARGPQVLRWLGLRLFVAEYDGELIEAGDKVVVRKARLVSECRWDERIARLFAADCAEAVLHIYERWVPGDSRPREAVEVARRFANGDATRAELAAAGDAARAAAWAARPAVGGAAWTAWAAGDAARDAAGAARAAAGAAEFEDANRLIFLRLCEYLNGDLA